MEGISIADALALTSSKEHESGFSFGGVGGLILILLFFFIFGGNWGLGGRGYAEGAGLSDLERDVLNGTANTQKEVLESRYTTQLGFQAMQAGMADCCCKTISAVHAEGEATRALIQANIIQDLRDRLAVANDALTTQTVSANVINAVRPFPVPAYVTCSPYVNYGYYGTPCSSNSVF